METEIKVCIEEKFHIEPKLLLTSEYLRGQLEKIVNISNEWPEAALLSLGRIAELWLLISLGLENTPRGENIVKLAEVDGIIDKHEAKLLSKIKRHYDNLKYKLYYKIEKNKIHSFVEEFSNINRNII